MNELLDAEGTLERALARLDPKVTYADALAECASGFRVRLEKSMTGASPSPDMKGVVFRAWTGSRWAETVARSLDAVDVGHAVDALQRELESSPSRGSAPPGPSPTGRSDGRTKTTRPIVEVPVEELIETARGWFDVAMAVPGISNTFANASYLSNDRLFLANSGARRYQSIQRVSVSVVPFALDAGRVEYDAIVEGATGGAEVLGKISEERVRGAAQGALELLQAKAAPTGKMTVLLDPSTAGTFAHESFGHGTEADQLLRERSYLKPLLGKVLGPESLTLVDDGSYPSGWGSIFFDDEGTPGRRNVLVDRGRFEEVLHDRETALELRRSPGGNARRADFLSRTFVRMTNTFVEPGDWGLGELVREARDGILLERCTSGIEDPLGGQMQLKVKRARRIEHGELTTPYSSMALSGRVLDFLRSIRGVGRKEYFEMSPGFCGKGHTDILPAGTGGSYLLSEAVVGPA
jgi:TldD protein